MEGQNSISSSLVDTAPQNEKLAAKTFSAKFRSKKEVWNFLSIEVGAFLPPYENITIYHMKDLIMAKKKIIKASAIKVLHVPQYKSLKYEKILEHAKGVPDIKDKLPDKDSETFKFPKSYVCNIIYTVLGDRFKEWVKEQIDERNENVAIKQNLLIDIDKDVAAAFYKSTAVSLDNGIGSNLLKMGIKRRRTKQELDDEKDEIALRDHQNAQRLQQIQDLKAQLEVQKTEAQHHALAHDLIQGLVNEGKATFSEDGVFQLVQAKVDDY